jgi:hypothetical protein
VSKIRFSDCGFAPIRRGLREHLGRMSSDAVKLYLWLHLVACWTGKKCGTVETSYAEIIKEFHWTESRVKRAFVELRDRYIKATNRGNQYHCSTIRILKYKKKPQRAQATSDRSKTAGATRGQSSGQSTGRSTLRIAAKTQAIRSPKKAEESIRIKAAAAAVWTFLEIEPCGHFDFRALLESCWASRGGEPPSAVIGRCLDGWRDSNAGDETWKRGLAPLFRALNSLRQSEKIRVESDFKEEIPLATVNA